jgi:endonuclease/exonuclease/phosphatase (EEP) superfamily protein YafD
VLSGSRRSGLVAAIAALPFAAMVADAAVNGAPVAACPAAPTRFQVASINLLEDNRSFDAAIGFVSDTKPDIVAFQEAVGGWSRALDRLDAIYPYRAEARGGSTRLFSRHPLVSEPIIRVVPSLYRSVAADIDLGGTVVRVVAVHFLKPETASNRNHRSRQMSEIRAFVANSRLPAIVMGDFNAAPTSFDFRALVDAPPLRAPALQIPPVSTWPARFPGLGIQIDHILATGQIRFESVAAGPDVGSNHLPVTAGLAIDREGVCDDS